MKRSYLWRAAGCSAVVALVVVLPLAAYAQNPVERVSLTDDDQQHPLFSMNPSVSANGRYVAYAQGRDAMGSIYDVYVRDRWNGTTTAVSVTPSGALANGYSESPRISADGNYVAFTSTASDIVIGDTNDAQDVFVRDLRPGGTTALATANVSGVIGNGWSVEPSISANGRYVAFQSGSTNLVTSGAQDGDYDVFVKDMETDRVVQANLTNAGGDPSCPGWGGGCTSAESPEISANGDFVVFHTSGAYTADDVNFSLDVYRRNMSGGIVRVSTFGPSTGYGALEPAVSADGTVVAYTFYQDYSDTDAIVYDFADQSETEVDVPNEGGEADSGAEGVTISPNGALVGFASWATNLVVNDSNDWLDGFVYDRAASHLSRIARGTDGGEGNAPTHSPVFANSGAVFTSEASNLVTNDTNDNVDVFWRSL